MVAGIAAALVLSVGAGFGAALVTRTDAAKAGSSSQVVKQLKHVNSKLNTISKQIGHTYENDSLIGRVDQVANNTYETCKDASATAFCHYGPLHK